LLDYPGKVSNQIYSRNVCRFSLGFIHVRTTVGLQRLTKNGSCAVDRTSPERISRLVEIILDEAVRRQASDVHIEPTVSEILIRFRLDGVLHTGSRPAAGTIS
jgi:type II secretory ATPase GspE/PulE/Tfp pilus assembly ATPase PilB-like protein